MDFDKDAWERGMAEYRRMQYYQQFEQQAAVFTPWSPDRQSQWRQASEPLVTKDVAEWLAEWFSKS